LPDPSPQFLKELENTIFEFLWNGKRNKIKKSTLYSCYNEGGLKMINVNSFLASLKISNLRRLMRDPKDSFIGSVYEKLLDINKFGGEFANVLLSEIKNDFWHDVLKHYKNYCNKCRPKNVHEFLSENIFYNGNILRDRKIIYIKSCINAGVCQIGHLVKDTGVWLTHKEFCEKFLITHCNFVLYYGVLNAVQRYMTKCDFSLCANFKLCSPKAWFNIGKGNRFIQTILNECDTIPTAVTKWNSSYPELEWNIIYFKRYKTSPDPRLIWFQTRLLHRILPTNRYLHICKIAESPLCTFCTIEEETIIHLFWSCGKTELFWNNLKFEIKNHCPHATNLQFSEELILFGTCKNIVSDKALDFIILLAKYFIYKCKLENTLPLLNHYMSCLRYSYVIEKYAATKKGKCDEFCKNWLPYQNLLST
jgi:hypothetical protein